MSESERLCLSVFLFMFVGTGIDLSISQFLHNLGLVHLLEIFDREQVTTSVATSLSLTKSDIFFVLCCFFSESLIRWQCAYKQDF